MIIENNKNIYAIIPVYNRKETTLNCLENLQQIGDLDRYSVIIIDDGSTDGTSEAIQAQFPQVKILKGDGNLWWTGAIRMGMDYAIQQGAEYLIWLNDDCRVSPGTLTNLVQFCQAHSQSIVGCQGFEKDHPDRLSFGGKHKTWQGYRFMQIPPGKVVPCDLLSGNLVCFPASVVNAIGLPNPAETPHYGGDSLYLLRSQQAGFSLYVDSRHPVFNHSGEPTLNPRDWIMAPGDPWQILRLAFNPYSGLSWQLWLRFNWEAYQVWGLVMFLKKYLSLIPITALRCLPLKLRQHLFPHRI